MDQAKIGKFIAELRKEQNMTQRELADKLGITDRAVSKWENGRGMPDLSLIKPLCEALSVSINELLSGERIKKEDIKEKSEENIINTLDYTDRSIKNTKKIFFSILAAVIFIFVTLAALFLIDINRMQDNYPVLFSTWGFDYTPPIDLREEKIEIAIKEYLTAESDKEPKHHEDEKAFIALRTYLIEETEAEIKVYAWVLEEKYYTEDDEIKKDSGSSVPHKFTINELGDNYAVVDSQTPRDGSYYAEDMKSLFPGSVRDDMDKIYTDGTSERLELEISEQVRLYFHK